MSRLGSNHNLYNACLNILRENGFSPEIYKDDPETDLQDVMWIAKIDDHELLASNPIELLGLASIYSHRTPTQDKPYWWVKSDDADVYDELVDLAFPD